ncbi:MAG: formate dehydrogenase subunit alpha [Flavobacteriales bacterium]|nr:formate dehydrogenase subunit alpha [Flavobacteriales bacterium]
MKAYIDNEAYEINKGETMLEFVRRIKGHDSIPTMCQADNLENFGSCRVCSVDVALQKEGKAKSMASCHTPVSEGQYIYPNSERIVKLRKNITELILSDYPEDKIYPKEGKKATEFQDTIAKIGIPEIRYPEGENHLYLERDTEHPYIKSDLSQCINCYRCVRACEEIQGEMILGMSGRGFANSIIKGFDTTFDLSACVACGACVQTCPTEALTDKYETKTIDADEVVRTTCTYCGVGCQLDISVVDGQIKGIQAPIDADVNAGHTCIKGRYAFEFYNHPDRVKEPMIRKNGKLEEVSWDEAYDYIAKNLTEIKSEYGPDSIGGISSSRATNEENYLMQKFIRVVIGTNNIDGCARVCHAPTAFGMQKAFGTGAATNSIYGVGITDAFLVIGANPTHAHPVTGAKLKQEFMKGKTSIVIDPVKTDLARLATHHLQLRPGTNVAALNMFMYYLIKDGFVDCDRVSVRTEHFDELRTQVLDLNMSELEEVTGLYREEVRAAANAYGSADKAMEFHGLGVTEHFQGSKTVMLLANIAMMTGNVGKNGVGLNPLRGQNNVQGAADMGVQPHQGAGYMDVNNLDAQKYYAEKYGVDKMPEKEGLKIPEMFDEAIAGRFKALWIMGEDTLMTDPNTRHIEKAFAELDLLIVQELFMSATAEAADVVLPASSYLEKNGTFTNGERRVQRVNKVVESIGNSKPDGQIMVDIMNKMGYEQKGYDAKVLLEEISDVVPFFKGITWDRLAINGLQWPVSADGKDTKILHEEMCKHGKGRFHYFDYKESPELQEHSEKFPFILTTSRRLEHYNSGTMTRRTDNQLIAPHDYLQINPANAFEKKIVSGEKVRIFSSRGSVEIIAKISEDVEKGVVRTTFHQPEVFINIITGNVGDEYTLTPEYKVVAVDFEKLI